MSKKIGKNEKKVVFFEKLKLSPLGGKVGEARARESYGPDKKIKNYLTGRTRFYYQNFKVNFPSGKNSRNVRWEKFS